LKESKDDFVIASGLPFCGSVLDEFLSGAPLSASPDFQLSSVASSLRVIQMTQEYKIENGKALVVAVVSRHIKALLDGHDDYFPGMGTTEREYIAISLAEGIQNADILAATKQRIGIKQVK
jgi:hypothetical protein